MTDDKERRENLPTTVEAEPANGEDENGQGELFPLERFLDIEEQRIESYNRRTELGHKAIEAQDAADQRQFEYHCKQLDAQDEQSKRQHGLARQVFWGGGGFCGVVLILILGKLFFGSEGQASAAATILTVLGTAIGGGGALHLLSRWIRWLLSR